MADLLWLIYIFVYNLCTCVRLSDPPREVFCLLGNCSSILFQIWKIETSQTHYWARLNLTNQCQYIELVCDSIRQYTFSAPTQNFYVISNRRPNEGSTLLGQVLSDQSVIKFQYLCNPMKSTFRIQQTPRTGNL